MNGGTLHGVARNEAVFNVEVTYAIGIGLCIIVFFGGRGVHISFSSPLDLYLVQVCNKGRDKDNNRAYLDVYRYVSTGRGMSTLAKRECQ